MRAACPESVVPRLGLETDSALAAEIGVPLWQVRQWRLARGIKRWYARKNRSAHTYGGLPWHEKLGKVRDSALAMELGLTRERIRQIRKRFGIPRYRPPAKPHVDKVAALKAQWKADRATRIELAAKCKSTKEFAEAIKRSHRTALRILWALRLEGYPAPYYGRSFAENKAWRRRLVAVLRATESNTKAAARLGISEAQASACRRKLLAQGVSVKPSLSAVEARAAGWLQRDAAVAKVRAVEEPAGISLNRAHLLLPVSNHALRRWACSGALHTESRGRRRYVGEKYLRAVQRALIRWRRKIVGKAKEHTRKGEAA